MTARWEVVRKDARGPKSQPWHIRLYANGNILVHSETLSRKVGAERAIVSVARIHGLPVVGLKWNVEDVEKVMVDAAGQIVPGAPLVHYLDWRRKS